jgi:hypothetical protein
VQLYPNRPSGQLSPRTPAAIFNLDVRANALLSFSSNLTRHNSAHASRSTSHKQSISYSFVFSIF